MENTNPNEEILVDAIIDQNKKLDDIAASNDIQVDGILKTNNSLEELNQTAELILEGMSKKEKADEEKIQNVAEEFTMTVKGIRGEKGEKGDKGDKGDTGEKGDTGPVGPKGDKGDKGEVGMTGPKGDTGPVGKTGKNGTDGKNGVDGKVGPKGPKGDAGKDVDDKKLKEIEEMAYKAFQKSSKTVSLVELDDVNLNGLTITNGKYDLGSGGGGGSQNLQQVTDIGATTTVESTFSGGLITTNITGDTFSFLNNDLVASTDGTYSILDLGGSSLGGVLNVRNFAGAITVALDGDTESITTGYGYFAEITANTFYANTGMFTPVLNASDSTGLVIKNSVGVTVGTLGASNSTMVTLAGNLTLPTTTSTTGTLYSNTDRLLHTYGGATNLFLGIQAGNFTMTGTENSGIGYQTLDAVTTGNSNMAFGAQSLSALTTGNYNVAIGRQALLALTTGSQNTAVGRNSMYNLAGAASTNVGIGDQTLFDAVNGVGNTAVGTQALLDNIPASNAQGYNTGIGYVAGGAITTGQRNVFLGALAGYTGTLATGNDMIAIGYNVHTTASNQINIGNTIYGNTSTGNVGVGTASPSKKLHVYGTGNAIRLTYPSAADWDTTVNSSGTFGFAPNNGANALSITTGGNIGVGTVSPTSVATRFIHVYDAGSAGYSFQNSVRQWSFFVQGGTGNYGLYNHSTSTYGLMFDGSNRITTQLSVMRTTEQIRSGYDASNYWNATTDSTGITTFNAVGAGAKFVFSDNIELTQTVTTEVVVSDTTVTMVINGTTYKLLAKA